jgi:hypothetical protein
MNLSIMCNTLGENQSVSDLALQIIYMRLTGAYVAQHPWGKPERF